ncbi:MAG: monovalent cation/H+ antiporter subunit D family protein [Alphaproteobacteria bacterium]
MISMSFDLAIALSLIIPVVGTILIGMSGDRPNQRETVTLLTAISLFAVTLWLLPQVAAGARPEVSFFEVLPGMPLKFVIEPLGMLFATIASGLWIVNSIYAIGYMRNTGEVNHTRFFMCFPISIGAALGMAYAGNLFTLFIFYEVLTLSTYPLVAHRETEEAKKGARIYLGVLLTTSIGLLLPAIIATYMLTGTTDFTAGGILADHVSPTTATILLALFMFGIGKAALMPFHKWLPSAMVAPTPVSSVLHAVAVVKAGVFSVLKIGIYIFGIDYLADADLTFWLQAVSAFTLVTASIIALTKDNLKARLAYSTISQLAYVVFGLSLATAAGFMGGSLQIAMHAVGKITLFYFAGAIYVAHHKTEVSQLNGLGRKMPLSFIAYTIGALSIIGLPPFGGAWPKFVLMEGAVDAGQPLLIAVLIISSLLNIAYLLPITVRGFFLKPDGEDTPAPFSWDGVKEAPFMVLAPLCFTAFLCFVMFFAVDAVEGLIAPILN